MSEVGYMAHRQKMLHTPDTFSFSPRERRFSKEAPNLKQTVSRNVNSSAWQAHEKTKCRVELLGKWRLLAKLLSCCVFSYLACLITSHHISRLLCFVPWMIFSSLVIDFDKSCNRFWCVPVVPYELLALQCICFCVSIGFSILFALLHYHSSTWHDKIAPIRLPPVARLSLNKYIITLMAKLTQYDWTFAKAGVSDLKVCGTHQNNR